MLKTFKSLFETTKYLSYAICPRRLDLASHAMGFIKEFKTLCNVCKMKMTHGPCNVIKGFVRNFKRFAVRSKDKLRKVQKFNFLLSE